MEQLSAQSRWVQIDLAAIRHNYQQIRKRLQPQVRLLGVVKADAYGNGAVEVSRTLEKLGVDMLGVTTLAEGLALRSQGITAPILVFSPFLPAEASSIVDQDLTATIASLASIPWLGEVAQQQKQKISVHLKVETGMGRSGLWLRELGEAAATIARYPQLQLTGVYSHLATATQADPSYTNKQYQLFQQAVQLLEEAGYPGLIKHIANSAALLKYPQLHLDMVRTGTLLFGQYPTPQLAGAILLQDPWSFQARVCYVRELPPGHSVGYGRTYTTKKATQVAVIPVGYSDGLQMEPVFRPVNLLELLKGMVKLGLLYLGHPRMAVPVFFPEGQGRIIGKVGMQLTMVDITGIPNITVGTVARLPLRRTAVNPLITKVYLDSQATAASN